MTRWIAMVLVVVAATPASAQPDEDDRPREFPDPLGPDIVITSPGERTMQNRVVLGSVFGAGVALGGIGLYFNLDARSARDQVSAKGTSHPVWTAADEDTYQRAHSSGVKAAVFYSLGGAALIGAAIALIATEPRSETTVIHPHRRAKPTVAPAPGGAILGGSWTF